MKICVIGLGLIGGSMCMALTRAGHTVHGWNRSQKAIDIALQKGAISQVATDFTQYDCVIVALPVKATLSMIESIAPTLKKGQILSDICGVKACIEQQILTQNYACSYVGLHPMAGKEVSTIENAEATLFDHASMVITTYDGMDLQARSVCEQLTKDMGFCRIVECSATVHDKKIAYTSQLAHIVSNAYVKDEEIENCLGFTGGSFQDMTRIAGVDEKVWSELYLANHQQVISKIDHIISALMEIRNAVQQEDIQQLEQVLARGRMLFTQHKDLSDSQDIKVIPLK